MCGAALVAVPAHAAALHTAQHPTLSYPTSILHRQQQAHSPCQCSSRFRLVLVRGNQVHFKTVKPQFPAPCPGKQARLLEAVAPMTSNSISKVGGPGLC